MCFSSAHRAKLHISSAHRAKLHTAQLVMLLRRAEPQHSHVAPPGLFEAVLETISANAVPEQNLQLE